MPSCIKTCRNCSAMNYAFSKLCTSCGVVFGIKNNDDHSQAFSIELNINNMYCNNYKLSS